MPLPLPESHASFPAPVGRNESTAPLCQNETPENQSAWLSNGPGETPDRPAISAQNFASPALPQSAKQSPAPLLRSPTSAARNCALCQSPHRRPLLSPSSRLAANSTIPARNPIATPPATTPPK